VAEILMRSRFRGINIETWSRIPSRKRVDVFQEKRKKNKSHTLAYKAKGVFLAGFDPAGRFNNIYAFVAIVVFCSIKNSVLIYNFIVRRWKEVRVQQDQDHLICFF